MKPVALTLSFLGVLLLAGATWASQFIAVRTKHSYSANGHALAMRITIWGKPISLTSSQIEIIDGKAKTIVLSGDCPNGQWNGPWSKKVTDSAGNVTQETVWYIDDREVRQEEWERNH